MATEGKYGTESNAPHSSLDRPTERGDAISALACIVLAGVGAFVIVPAWVYVPKRVAGTIDSPAIMPLLMLALLGLFGAVLLARTVRIGSAAAPRRSRQDWYRAAGMMAICGAYLALVIVIGLPAATAIALAGAMLYFGERRWLLILLVAVVTPLLLWAFFAYVAYVPMPQPLLELVSLEPHRAGGVA